MIALVPELVLGVFTNLDEIIEGGVPTVYVLLGALSIAFVTMFYNFAMSGMGLTKETSLAATAASLSYAAYIFLITQVSNNVAVAWTAEYVYNIVVGIVCWYFFRQHRWRVV